MIVSICFAKDEITLWGEPAEILRHLIEIRGVGIIDVMSLYGAGVRQGFFTMSSWLFIWKNYDHIKLLIVLETMQRK